MKGINKILTKAANLSEVAHALGITEQAAYQWKRKGRVPQQHVRRLCEVYDLAPHDIRPDLFERGWVYPEKK